MLRNIFAVTGGILTGLLGMFLINLLSQLVYPVPPGLDLTNFALLKIIMAFVPDGVFLFLAGGWLLAAFLAATAAALISRVAKAYCAYITGAVLLCMALVFVIALPHPFWLWFLGIAVFLVGTWLGKLIGARPGVVANIES